MPNRMIIGRYIETGSWVHQLDPRAKILAMLCYSVMIFTIDSLWKATIVLLLSAVLIICTKIPIRTFLRSVKPLLFIILFIFLFHALFDAGGSTILAVGPVRLYAGGIEKGGIAAVRMILFVAFTGILTFTTLPFLLIQGLEAILKPLRVLRISPQKISLMVSISLRFIPTIFEETEKILKAQASRGMDLKDQKLVKKAQMLLALLVPVTIGAFRRALELVDSMESRGYQLDMPRTKYRVLRWSRTDTLFIGAFILAMQIFLIVRFMYAG